MSGRAMSFANSISKGSVIKKIAPSISAFGLVSCLMISGCGAPDPEAAKPPTALTAVARTADSVAAPITGQVRSLGAYDIATETPGRLIAFRANVGDRVARGQVLAVFDLEPLQLQASQAQAQARGAVAELEAARREVGRLEGLVLAGAAAQQDLDAARTALRRAEAQQRATADQASISQRAVSKATLRAPAAGVVTVRTGDLGTMVAAGAVVFSLEAGGEREIIAPVPSTLASRLRPGSMARFNVGGAEGRAQLSGLSPQSAGVDAQTARFTIISGAPAPGSAVSLWVAGDDASAGEIVVPLSAVMTDRSGARSVLVVRQNGTTAAEPVSLIDVSSAGARVRGRLSPGQTVVAAGPELIRAGERVRPLPFTP